MNEALNSNTNVKMLILFLKYSPRRLLGAGGNTVLLLLQTHGYFQKESSKRNTLKDHYLYVVVSNILFTFSLLEMVQFGKYF